MSKKITCIKIPGGSLPRSILRTLYLIEINWRNRQTTSAQVYKEFSHGGRRLRTL